MKRVISIILVVLFLLNVVSFNCNKINAAAVLDRPDITSPSDGESFDLGRVTVRWDYVSGADYYKIAVLDTATGSKIINNEIVDGTSYKISSGDLTEGHTYKIAVGAFGDDGSESYWAYSNFSINNQEITQLDTPKITSPSDGDSLDLGRVNIRWNSVSGADYYKIAVLDTTTGSKIIDNETVDGTSYKISSGDLTEGHNYKIAVGACGDNGSESYWADSYFSIKSIAPTGSVNISSPTNGASYNIGTQISLRGSVTGNGYSYTKFFVKADSNSSSYIYGNNELYGSSPSDTWNTAGMQAGTYYIYAVVYGNNGEELNKRYVSVTLKSVPVTGSVNISSPTNGASYNIGTQMSLRGSVTGNGYSYTKFFIKADPNSSSYIYGTNDLSGSSPSDTWDTTGMQSGTYYICMVTYDNYRNEIDKKYISVVLTSKATISMASPENGASYAIGARIPLSASISGSGYSSTKFFVKTSTSTTSYIYGNNAKTGSSPSDTWDTTGMEAGTYYIYAVTYDSFGNELDKKYVSIVLNKPTMSNFSLNKTTIVIGETVSFSGTITGNGGTIEKVTINIQGPDNRTLTGEYASKSLKSSTFNMSNISSFKAGESWMKTPGKYWVEVWAKNKDGVGVKVGEKDVEVIKIIKVSGVVRNKYTNELMDGVSLTLSNLTTTTAAGGKFTFEKVAVSSHIVTAKKDGYTLIDENGNTINQITEFFNDTNNQLNLYMVAKTGYSITGYVKTSSGEAVPGVEVKPFAPNVNYNAFAVKTDPTGKFIIPEVAASGHTIIASKEGYASEKDSYYVQIPSSSDVNIVMNKLTTLDGFVYVGNYFDDTTKKNQFLKGAAVWLNAETPEEAGKFISLTNSSGQYYIDGIAPIPHTLHAQCYGYKEKNSNMQFSAENGPASYKIIMIPEKNMPSDWAKTIVTNAYNTGLITEKTKVDFRGEVSRLEFCELAVKLYEKLKGTPIDISNVQGFCDVSSADIVVTKKARAVGITNGTGENKFSPRQPIRRQDICLMLYNMLQKLYPRLASDTGKLIFNDISNISNSAKKAIAFVTDNNIMNGRKNNAFAPNDNASKEEVITIIMKTFENKNSLIKDIISDVDSSNKFFSFSKDDINELCNEDLFNSSSYLSGLNDNSPGAWAKQISIFVGNNFYGSNHDKEIIYQEMLIDYFEALGKQRKEELELLNWFQVSLQYLDTVHTVLDKPSSEELKQINNTIEQLSKEMKTQLKNVDTLSNSSSLYKSKELFYKDMDEITKEMQDITLKDNALRLELDTGFAKKVQSVTKKTGILLKVFSVGVSVMSSFDMYSDIESSINIIDDNIYVLRLIIDDTNDNDLKTAAQAILDSVQSKRNSQISLITTILKGATLQTGDVVIRDMVAGLNPATIAASVAASISDLTMGVSGMAKEAIRVCGAAEMAGILARSLLNEFSSFEVSSNNTYSIPIEKSNEYIDKYMNLAVARLFSESERMQLSEKQSDFADWLAQYFSVVSKEEMINACEANVKYITDNLLYKYHYPIW